LAERAAGSTRADVAERIYAALIDDEDARVCKDISDDACRVVLVRGLPEVQR
jgi:hypothetical protein